MPLHYVNDKDETIPVVCVIDTRDIQVDEEIWVQYVADRNALPFNCACCKCVSACKVKESGHLTDEPSWFMRQWQRCKRQQQTPIPWEVENRLRLTSIWRTV